MTKQIGYFSLLLGGLIGVLIVILLALALRLSATSAVAVQTPIISPDVTVSLSERSLSRLASETMQRPILLDFDSNGQVQVTTRLELGWLRPVVVFGLLLEMQGPNLSSELQWMRLGFLTIPARWLPQSMIEASAMPAQVIENQTPPDFILVGLDTSAEGLTFQLKWIGE